ncbi:prolyl oligopeptidase family serine peptidase [Massilia sp. W12]|uniref:S9 family peptidase n=1 Tax=Massilia sp. W12 TaxID=3126507 RepID=UPI0030CBACD2
MKTTILSSSLALILAFHVPAYLNSAHAANAAPAKNLSGYQQPSEALRAIADAPRQPLMYLSPKRDLSALVQRPALPSIAQVAQVELKLAGLRIHPRNYSASRYMFGKDIWLVDNASGAEIKISGLPARLAVAELEWSPDQRHIAFTHVHAEGVELWLIDVARRQARRASPYFLNTVQSNGFTWLPDSQHLALLLRPPRAGNPPPKSTVPSGPNVQESLGRQRSQMRTIPDLLKDEGDAALFEHYTTVQLAIADLQGGSRLLGGPDQFTSVRPSPDGKFLLTSSLQKPWSYLVPAYYFSERFEVRDMQGKLTHLLGSNPLQETVPAGVDAERNGMRNVRWRADAPATLSWVATLDEGDPERKVEQREVLYSLAAPFTGKAQELGRFAFRIQHVLWGDDNLALVAESWRKTRREKVWRIAPNSKQAAELLFDLNSEDRYADPGEPVLSQDERGQQRLLMADANSIWLHGNGASPQGDRPFLDRFDLRSKKTERVFQSTPPFYEKVHGLLDKQGQQLIISREAPQLQPNYHLRKADGKLQALTSFPHPYPHMAGVSKEKIHYKRKDGVDLSGDLYLPAGYDAKRDGPLPILLWAYPHEFKSAKAASQVQGSPYRFNNISVGGPLPFLSMGFAVLDHPAMPIIGEGEKEPNDTFLPQLIANAEAALDAAVAMGVARRDQAAVGGHSYGAFMTANLLAHTRLFKAGLARSGAYNRSLTPFGFQYEERNFWQAREVYHTMSPFEYAHKIEDALLLVHGEQDNNAGTFPMQSERMFQAMRGLGKRARLVMLPNESHGYRARESVLHMLYESENWLNAWVKNPPKPEAKNGENKP